jgi:hypothetical protein
LWCGILVRQRELRLTRVVNDTARFLPDDADDLVVASFACPVCLHRPSYVRLSAFFEEAEATCACLPCRMGWEVALDGLQMLRLTLGPPSGLNIERGNSLSL